MGRCLLLPALLALAFGTTGSEGGEARRPVLVELFTSEGCSSCPPADALLARLDRAQPVAGALAIVMSEHVDYWNHIGWTDPYSSPAFSARQEAYARRFGTAGPYTPQMVIDGRAEFVGSDARQAEAAIKEAMGRQKVAVRIGGGADTAAVEVDTLPAGKVRSANVYVALAADHGVQDVLRGENQGRRLEHIAVVKELKQVGRIDQASGFRGAVPVERGMRLIVFVQEGTTGPVWGAAMRGSTAGRTP
jgi:hypothetical protein